MTRLSAISRRARSVAKGAKDRTVGRVAGTLVRSERPHFYGFRSVIVVGPRTRRGGAAGGEVFVGIPGHVRARAAAGEAQCWMRSSRPAAADEEQRFADGGHLEPAGPDAGDARTALDQCGESTGARLPGHDAHMAGRVRRAGWRPALSTCTSDPRRRPLPGHGRPRSPLVRREWTADSAPRPPGGRRRARDGRVRRCRLRRSREEALGGVPRAEGAAGDAPGWAGARAPAVAPLAARPRPRPAPPPPPPSRAGHAAGLPRRPPPPPPEACTCRARGRGQDTSARGTTQAPRPGQFLMGVSGFRGPQVVWRRKPRGCGVGGGDPRRGSPAPTGRAGSGGGCEGRERPPGRGRGPVLGRRSEPPCLVAPWWGARSRCVAHIGALLGHGGDFPAQADVLGRRPNHDAPGAGLDHAAEVDIEHAKLFAAYAERHTL